MCTFNVTNRVLKWLINELGAYTNHMHISKQTFLYTLNENENTCTTNKIEESMYLDNMLVLLPVYKLSHKKIKIFVSI